MKNEIKKYEQKAKLLEPNTDERKILTNMVMNYSEEFLNNINSSLTYKETEDKGAGIYDFDISDEPTNPDIILNAVKEHIDKPGINPASGGHMAYIPGGGIFYSALGDWLAAIINKYAGVFFAAPGAVRLENMLLRWIGSIAGYPSDAAGNLTSGGSIGNLIGIVAARDAKELNAIYFPKAVIYLTSHAHHSIRKSLRIAGLYDCIVREIDMDEGFRMIPGKLESAIFKDQKAGLIPFLAISSAGTTDTGAIDPLSDIGDICFQNKIWHHIDGAYGAFFKLSDLVADNLQGMEKSDSIVMDPHKGLFLPYGSGSVLVKNSEYLYNSFRHTANYMQDADLHKDEMSPNDLSPEMSKHFRALRLWLPLKLAGVSAFKAAINEKVLLARYFYENIQKIDGFEVGAYPELSIVTYRYVPDKGDADEFNKRLISEILKDGRILLSSTILNGKFTLRLVSMHLRTHLPQIELALELLKEKSEYIRNNF